MKFDFYNFRVPRQRTMAVDPVEIFQASAITDDNINDLWLAQGDALREWHTNRSLTDVAVVLNTGAGKTLVGLLIAQSLVNETERQVVYACSSIQLIEQTANKAEGYGLPVTTYYNQNFSNSRYGMAEAPCVTTYQALFNGRSRFARDDIAAVVLDDAHTAEHILREQFSLQITRAQMEGIYQEIASLFLPYHKKVGLETSYIEALAGESSRTFWVPPFEVRANLAELRRILVDAKLTQFPSTMFSWEHIRDHEDLCCLMLSSSGITLTPPTVPVSTLSCFGQGIRRVYLSATLRSPDAFARAFGRKPERIVAPSTTAGDCERMILVPSVAQSVEDDVATTKETINDKKALILTPSFARGNKWADVASLPRREEVPQAVDMFRVAPAPQKLTLAARYDGIDLPGDTCRVLVIDDLPTGLNSLERFQWDLLHMENSFRSTLASRIVQSFGRISRGMSDHGVVVITGYELVRWLQLPRNQSLLPKFLKKQLALGLALSESADTTVRFTEFARACLSRNQGWIVSYNEQMQDVGDASDPVEMDLEMSTDIALAEAKFGEALWKREFQDAALALQEVLEKGFELSQSTGAWLAFWLGVVLQMSGDTVTSREYYSRAYANQNNLPHRMPRTEDSSANLTEQVESVQRQMRIGHPHPASVAIPKTIVADLDPLSGVGSVPQMEEAVRCLGQYLGLESTRPEKEFGTGPDVLWNGEGRIAVCIELKTEKDEESPYWKKDVSQMHDHIQWVRDNRDVSKIVPVFVGPKSPAHKDANPTADMVVMELQQFSKLAEKLVTALEDASEGTLPLELGSRLHEIMANRGLLFPDVFNRLDKTTLSELQM